MIRVLHIGHSRKWRGGENQVRLLLEGLAKRFADVECHIAYPDGAIAVTRLQANVAGVLSLPSTRPYDPRSISAIVQYCKQNQIHILNAQSGNAHTLAFYSKLFLLKTKVVVHRRVDNSIKTSWFSKTKYLSKKIDRWIAISSKIASILENYGVEKNRISTIKSSVDVSSFVNLDKQAAKQTFCDQYHWDIQMPIVGFVGAVDSQKNPQLFVRVIAKLIDQDQKVNALIAGDGKLFNEIAAEVDRLNLTKNVKLLGFVENTIDVFSAIDIFFLPSRNEGLGTVLMEAVHAECSIVAADVGGISEIIINEKTGLLVSTDTEKDCITAINQIINDPGKAALYRENASEHVKENFDLNSMIERTYLLYKSLA